MAESFFDRLVWRDDRVLLDDLVFRFERTMTRDSDLGEGCFRFHKGKPLVDQYARFWGQRDFHPESMLELGLWDGGSVAFWNLCFLPRKHVGVDIECRSDSEYFRQFVQSRGAADRIKTFWGVDQADVQAMRSVIEREFSGTLDLVIDDASHMYEQTKASFETIYPRLRPGGLYVIEDWAWAHWRAFQSPDHRWARDEALTTLVTEVIEALGSSPGVVASITIFQGFAVIERGNAELPEDFRLSRYITRRPAPRSFGSRVARSLSFRTHRLLARRSGIPRASSPGDARRDD